MAKQRPLSRQKKTATMLAVLGLGGGVAAYFLFIRKKTVTPTISSAGVAVSRVPVANVASTPDVFTKGSIANKTFTAAQDAWYAIHPDEPFVNDDGTCNLLPGYEGNIPGCLGWE